jgi:hypothetical protein
MEYLRQIEEDIQNISLEGGKKYPEVADASNRALLALKMIRETYVAEIRKKDNPTISVKFKSCSEIVSPYILVCNHSESSQKLSSLSINGLLLLLKYDIVPASDVQNILRVLHIQVHQCIIKSPQGSEYYLKILQLLVSLVTLLANDQQNFQLLTEQTISTLLTISLTLTDNNKNPSSVTTASLGTTRQIIAIIMDSILYTSKTIGESFETDMSLASLPQVPASPASTVAPSTTASTTSSNDPKTVKYVWILQSTTLIIREMSFFMQGLIGNHIKITSVPQTFAMDVLYDILHGWKSLFHSLSSLKLQLHYSIIPSLQAMLKNIHFDFNSNHMKYGMTSASAFTVRAIQIVRFILLEFWTISDTSPSSTFDDFDHMITLLLHGTMPMKEGGIPSSGNEGIGGGGGNSSSFIEESSEKKKMRGNGINASSSIDANDNNGNNSSSFRNKFEEASSLISKFSSFTLSSVTSSTAKSSINASNMKGGVGGVSSNDTDAYITIGKSTLLHPNLPSSSSSSDSSSRLLPAHPAACCLEVLLSLLLCRSADMIKSEIGIKCLFHLINSLTTHSSNIVIAILSNENNVK